MLRDRILANLFEIAPLELVLEGDPVLPGLLDRDAEHVLELVGTSMRLLPSSRLIHATTFSGE